MSIDFEQMLVLLVLVIPGFIVTSMHRAFGTKSYENQFEWFVVSVIQSIFLNILTLMFFVNLNLIHIVNYEEAIKKLPQVPIDQLLFYIFSVYLVGAVWGAVTGKWQQTSLRSLAKALKITKYAPNPSVWDRLFEVQIPEGKERIWVYTKAADATEIFGRLRHSSEIVAQDKPIELYISPYFVKTNGDWHIPSMSSNENCSDGIYIKLTDEQYIQFYFKGDDWSPEIA